MNEIQQSLMWEIGRYEDKYPTNKQYKKMEDRAGVVGVVDVAAWLNSRLVRIWTTEALIQKSPAFMLAGTSAEDFLCVCREQGTYTVQKNGWGVLDLSGHDRPRLLSGRLDRLGEVSKRDKVYIMRDRDTGEYKIGFTSVDPSARRSNIQSVTGRKVDVICTWPGGMKEERAMHRIFDKYRTIGEWFNFSETVFLKYLPEVIEVFRGYRSP